MRRSGATVRTIPLYTTKPKILTAREKRELLLGKYSALNFKSPSGISGLLSQLDGTERKQARALEAVCIGSTTAKAARKSGFRRVRDLSI
jgi:uroporphyrinogen-III synthase